MIKAFLLLSFTYQLAIGGIHVPKKHPHNRIIGGKPANIADYPYQVSIQHDGSHDCGGSIINENYILTAAHCTDVDKTVKTTVVAGVSHLDDIKSSVRLVKEVFVHPNFKIWNYDYDIAILKLEEPLLFSDSVQPINLPNKNYAPAPSLAANLTGWGATKERSMDMSNILLVTEVPIVSPEDCSKAYPLDGINERDICAGYKIGGHDTCLGDSGGPLAIDGVLVGVASWGYGCGEPNRPGVYMNVAQFRDFINSIVGI